ncbi:MAG: UvrD-helicase domain-containing protein [Gallionella sp.]|nr:UvrD-helicase domain-containing protein [Gallionella sp.]
MDNRRALDPAQSVVVEACAGSGKTWLLVSRVVRLLLAGVAPGEILAITFTRRAAQEMQERLRDWLYELASRDDEYVRDFLRQRAVDEDEIAGLLPRARALYQQFLQASPPITISTFHGWFMQILQRAPLDSAGAGGVELVEQTSELMQEAWQIFLDSLHGAPDGETAISMMTLFGEIGLSNTQSLLRNFVGKRSEWWAYTAGEEGALACALDKLQREFAVDMDSDPVVQLFARPHFSDDVRALAQLLDASAAQKSRAERLLAPLDGELPPDSRFARLWDELFTQKNEPRTIKANKGQDVEQLASAVELVRCQMQEAYHQLQAQKICRINAHALRCGVALLDIYQGLKQDQQALDFGDLEWRVSQLLGVPEHAQYLQYKLDSRYHHVLLDEFQDTNPLQWQILQSWFAASTAAGTTPVVFVVGDPKQSIYRFRRADARLFDVVRKFMQQHYLAVHLKKNETRRNAPAVLAAVNGVFDGLAEYPGFEKHLSLQIMPGHVEVLPLAEQQNAEQETVNGKLTLRNPLLEPCPDAEEGAREQEALQFAEKIDRIVGVWQIRDEGRLRPLEFSDIMVLVRRRTHLKIYEQALRGLSIPFLTSRRGGLLDTLEASDIQSLLTFLITPFADLALAQTLRSPIFSCSDNDLMMIQASGCRMQDAGGFDSSAPGLNPESRTLNPKSWWQRLRQLVEEGDASAALLRAHRLLQGWLLLSDKLPVHDLLDRIYFEGDAKPRYAASVSAVMRATVLANLQAFLEIALDMDAARYPSLPGFLRKLAELRRADDNDSPDEGRVGQSGNALRIYTVHESKGLEAPLVWLLDTNARPPADRGYDALVDWPTEARVPAHFSMYCDKASRGAVREPYFEQEAALAQREDLNLLYVAMTRAKQVLMVSGSGSQLEGMWYQRIADGTAENSGQVADDFAATGAALREEAALAESHVADERLTQMLPTGVRKPLMSDAQRYGTWLHALLEHQAIAGYCDELYDKLQRKLNIPPELMRGLWQRARDLLNKPDLARFFDAKYYQAAANEVAYVDALGQLRRIDRLVEFEDEVWVLDYKSGATKSTASFSAQLNEYRLAMQAVHPEKSVRCAVIFADGKLAEV